MIFGVNTAQMPQNFQFKSCVSKEPKQQTKANVTQEHMLLLSTITIITTFDVSTTCWQSMIWNILILCHWHLSWHTRLKTHHIWVLWCTKP